MSVAVKSLEFLAAQVANAETQWSLGTFGGIAEFMRDRDEPVTLACTDKSVSAVTARGGVRIEPRADLRLFASESTTRESWAHRISLCLREDHCAMNQRTVLTELGPDTQALRPQDRGAQDDRQAGAGQEDHGAQDHRAQDHCAQDGQESTRAQADRKEDHGA